MKHGGYVVLQRLSTVLRHSVEATVPATPPPMPTGGGYGDAGGRGRFWPIGERKRDPLRDMVLQAIEEEGSRYAPTPEATQPAVAAPAYAPPSSADVAQAIDLLFASPRLASLEADMRERARTAMAETIADLEAEAHRRFLFAQHAASLQADDEAALMAILRLA